jgi:hypothetical protein
LLLIRASAQAGLEKRNLRRYSVTAGGELGATLRVVEKFFAPLIGCQQLIASEPLAWRAPVRRMNKTVTPKYD